MAVSDSPRRSAKRVGSPQIESQKQKKTKKGKRSEITESEPNPPDSTQPDESPPQSSAPSSPPRKRTKSPGVRVVGGRIYDSENGKTCHQCRQKTMDFVAACKGQKNNKPCTIKFCHKCLLNRYGENAEEMNLMDDWKCPKCRDICNCSFCMKKRGHQPTGILSHTAKATGFKSVSDMLTVNGPKAIGASPPEDPASNKENSSKGVNGSVLPSDEKKIKKHKKKKMEDNHTDGHVVEESREGGSQTKKKAKKTRIISDTNLNAPSNEKVRVTDRVDGVETKLKAKKNKCSKLEKTKSNVDVKEVKLEKAKSKVDVKEVSKENDSQTQKTTEKACPKGKKNINEGDVDKVKIKKSKNRKKITSDPTKTEGSEKVIPENEPKVITDCKPKTEPDMDIPLPQGNNLLSVADVELPAVDVGPALQFLEFCNTFEEILQLKKGEPESVLRELASGCSRRRRQYSSVVRFHVQLLDLIQQDMEEECPSITTSNGSSWFQKVGECISESQCNLKDMPLECFDRGSDGYDRLDLSQKLRLLNFLCEEALCTAGLRDWIEKQNEKFKESGKEAKEKVLAAKDKEKRLKQQMRDEVAKAILSRNGAPLSIAEHGDLVAQIKLAAANAQAEKLEALGMVPKKKQRADAIRTEPILLNENGLLFWKLQSYSAEPSILLQDAGLRGSHNPEEKWFTFDVEQKEAVESYITSQRKKRLRLQIPSDACGQKRRKHMKIDPPISLIKDE